jgi:capsular exopolysaccharide synthesis family protein
MSRVFEATKVAKALSDEAVLSFASGEFSAEPVPKPKGPEVLPFVDLADGPCTPSMGYRRVSIHVGAPGPILPFDGDNPRAAERYRILRTRIVHHPRQARLLCISSTSPRDGKTTTTVNLASALALKKETTALLIDVDLRRPQLAKLLGISETPGLADFLAGKCTLREAIVQFEDLPNLYFLPSGRAVGNPAELLDSDQWRNATEYFRKEFDHTVMDSPPIGPVADFDLIQAVCDGVILVVRPRHTNRDLLHKGMNLMNEKFMGAVVNCAEDWFLWRAQDASYYGYGSKPKNSKGR